MDAASQAVTAREVDDRTAPVGGVIDALDDLSTATPGADARLVAALEAMETAPSTDWRAIAAPAERAERLAVELGRPDLRIRARLLRADVFSLEGDQAASGRIAHEAHAWATEHGHAYLLARSHRQLSLFFYRVGDLADALAHAVQCVAHTGEDAAPAVRARHLSTLAVMLDGNGSLDEARRRFHEALDIATAIGDARLSLQILNNMAYTAYSYQQLDEATQLMERMRALQDRHGIPLAATDLDTIARVEMTHGRYAEAEATLRPILDGVAEHLLDEGKVLAECLLTVAEAQRLRGDLSAAQATLDRTVGVCEERGLASLRARVRDEQSQLYAAMGRYREAYEEYRVFHADALALQSAQREARARILQAVFETEEARRDSIRFREMARRDALTSLYNRRFVDEQLTPLLADAAEQHTPISVALIDLDHFKRINDTLSHAAGDAVLQQIAMLLGQAATDDGVAARLGGEEFLLILPGAGSDDAVRRCERLRRTIRAHHWRPITGDIPVTASIGVTTVEDGRGTPSALLAQADHNLYAAKRTGRDQVVADAT